MRQRVREEGFTLVELAIVCVVIGILAAIAVPNYARTKARAGRASCVSNQRNLFAATTIYAVDHQLIDAVLNSEVLFNAHIVPGGLAECPDSHDDSLDDYDITIEGGEVTDVECTFAPDEHVWHP